MTDIDAFDPARLDEIRQNWIDGIADLNAVPDLLAIVDSLHASRQLSDAYARRIDALTAARLGHVGDREDPETGAALPAGVEGVSLGRASDGAVKTVMAALTPDDPALPDEPVTDAERVSAAKDKAAEAAGEVA